MSPDPTTSPTAEVDGLRARLRALSRIADLGQGRLDEPVLARIQSTLATATARLGHGTSHTVVALAGATGSGKSSLFNAITGTEWATTGIRRPTTSSPLAAVYGDGAGPLLDWLEIPNRQRHEGGSLEGLVLLDLPDHDSKVTAHRAEVDRLVAVVDVFGWVVDPQKYADAALHEGYLRQFGRHGAVTMVLLNQIDRLDAEARAGTIAHLGALLAEDGLGEVRVLPTSAVTGEGVDALRRELAARVAERRAIVTRIDADLDWLATDLTASLSGLADRTVSASAREQVVIAATEAAGGSQLEAAVAGSYRHRGSLAVGWPLLRWIRKTRPDPLARLGLGTRRPIETGGIKDGVAVRRTAISADPLAVARLDEAMRHLSQDVTRGLPETARRRLESVIESTRDELPESLDEAAGRTDLHLEPPRWWAVLGTVQWVVAAGLIVGLIWVLALWGLAWFQFPPPPRVQWRGFPVQSLLALGGLILGPLLATIGRRLTAVGGARRGRQARASLSEHVAGVIDEDVVLTVTSELGELSELRRALARL
ncbi:MAG: 50S ribosome-binding GTPase [Kineosporiaceae bacterium]|nr:50S ribosome-binding GTPase [Kineosporiaceae bacterium]